MSKQGQDAVAVNSIKKVTYDYKWLMQRNKMKRKGLAKFKAFLKEKNKKP